jgi:hypothetical protein
MKCGVCHRILRSPESIKIGYGPVCYGRIAPVDRTEKRKRTTRTPRSPARDDVIPGQLNLSDFMDF